MQIISTPLMAPALALMLLTLLVWVYMFIRRFTYIISNRVDAQAVSTPEKLNGLIPEQYNWPANNLKNLFELPVLFYALCILITLGQANDQTFTSLAWTYAGLRAIHSAVQCTVNIVMIRFAVYALSSVVLWFMLCRFALQIFMG